MLYGRNLRMGSMQAYCIFAITRFQKKQKKKQLEFKCATGIFISIHWSDCNKSQLYVLLSYCSFSLNMCVHLLPVVVIFFDKRNNFHSIFAFFFYKKKTAEGMNEEKKVSVEYTHFQVHTTFIWQLFGFS